MNVIACSVLSLLSARTVVGLFSRRFFIATSSSSVAGVRVDGGGAAVLRPRDCSCDQVVVVIGGGAAGYFGAIECARILHSNQQQKNSLQSQSSSATVVEPNTYQVHVLEASQSVLSKVLISGGGRCNVMHNPMKGASSIAKGYPRGSKELIGPLNNKFSPWDTYDWFEQRGVQLKTEPDGRVFPTTDRAATIADTLQRAAELYGVSIQKGAKVVKIIRSSMDHDQGKGRYSVHYFQSSGEGMVAEQGMEDGDDSDPSSSSSSESSRIKTEKVIVCDKIIMATGSSRLGYEMLGSLGHALQQPLPSLFSFKIPDPALTALSGVSCKYSRVRLLLPPGFSVGPYKHLLRGQQTGASFVQRGPMLVTKQGLSGPAILKLSSFAARVMAALKYRFDIEVSLVGDLDMEDLTQHLIAEKRRHPSRSVGKCFPHLSEDILSFIKEGMDSLDESIIYDRDQQPLLDKEEVDGSGSTSRDGDSENSSGVTADTNIISRRLWLYLLDRLEVSPQMKWGEVSLSTINRMVELLSRAKYSVEGRGLYRDEFVTCGGVSLKEVQFSTMESRIAPGVYLAGEVLDIDGITGGYNFQSAWTTGFIAGSSCANSLVAG